MKTIYQIRTASRWSRVEKPTYDRTPAANRRTIELCQQCRGKSLVSGADCDYCGGTGTIVRQDASHATQPQ